jgi:hypothetical protein
LTAAKRDLHEEILPLRSSFYAHSDDSPFRQAVDSADDFAVHWLYPTPSLLTEVYELARAQLAHFLASKDVLEARIAAAEAPRARRRAHRRRPALGHGAPRVE